MPSMISPALVSGQYLVRTRFAFRMLFFCIFHLTTFITSCDGNNKCPYIHTYLDVKKDKMLRCWEEFNTSKIIVKY